LANQMEQGLFDRLLLGTIQGDRQGGPILADDACS